MKIVFIGGVEIPKNGGIETYIYNMSLQLTTMGHNVWIICQGKSNKNYIQNGIKITQIQSSSSFLSIINFLKKATELVANCNETIDIVNYHRFYFTKQLIKPLIKKNINCCFTNHSFGEDNPKHSILNRILLRIINHFAFKNINNCITVSNHGAKRLKELYGNDSTVIRGGIFMPPPNISGSDILSKYNIQKNSYYLSISRIDPVKNLDKLITAFNKNNNTDIKLVIAGDYDNQYGKYLLSLSENNSNIVFTGPVYGCDKDTLLKNSLAYCLVSKSEGFPIALLEAMSFGKICIVSDIDGNREALKKDCGLWINPNDYSDIYVQMLKIQNKNIDSEKISHNVRQIVSKNFTWEKSAKDFIYYINNLKLSY